MKVGAALNRDRTLVNQATYAISPLRQQALIASYDRDPAVGARGKAEMQAHDDIVQRKNAAREADEKDRALYAQYAALQRQYDEAFRQVYGVR